jgi:hypothetical protein
MVEVMKHSFSDGITLEFMQNSNAFVVKEDGSAEIAI